MDVKEIIARRVAQEFKDGYVVNLGLGIPTMAANYVPSGVEIVLHGENGMFGIGADPTPEQLIPELVNASGSPITALPGASFFGEDWSFCFMRSGILDLTVLGALQVDAEGNIANWKNPGVFTPGIGGAMDLVVGAKSVIVVMQHLQKGEPKILQRCTLPLTGAKCVNKIITEMAYFEVTPKGLVLKELGPGFTVEAVKKATAADFTVADKVGQYFD
jgi:3-oxoacid CoA-transferase B subunit